MTFEDYLRNHTHRAMLLDATEGKYANAGINPIYVSTTGLIDVSTMCSFIAVHEGTKLVNEFEAMERYLKGNRVRHPEDSAADYSMVLDQYRRHKNNQTVTESAHPYFPFFVHPVTAFFFMRWHLRNSPQLYGVPLTPSAMILTGPARELIVGAADWMQKEHPFSWWMGNNDARLKLQSGSENQGDRKIYWVDVIITIREISRHVKIELGEDPRIPDLEEIVNHEKILPHLKGWKTD